MKQLKKYATSVATQKDRTMKKLILVLPLLAMTAACASRPESIVPVGGGNVSVHDGKSCSTLHNEKAEVDQLVQALSARQNKAANADAWGVFLLGVPVASLSGAEVEAELAIAKGDQLSLRAAIAVNCR